MTEENPTADMSSSGESKPKNNFVLSKLSLIILLIAALVTAGMLWWLYNNQPVEPNSEDTKKSQSTTTTDDKTADKKDPTKDSHTINCGNKMAFISESFGMKFCYPSEWGTASVHDAKLASSDAGWRQVVKFADMPLVQVGGVSDDWATTVGRDGICFDPSNQVPPLSSYNSDWHNQVGAGASLEFAIRSLASSAGGYAMTEEVSNLLQSGICARGYKVINSSHYRVGSVSFYRDFAPASGITTPAGHVAEPNVLFSAQLRTDFDALLASLVAY